MANTGTLQSLNPKTLDPLPDSILHQLQSSEPRAKRCTPTARQKPSMALSIPRSFIPRSLFALARHFHPHPNRTHFFTHRPLSTSSSSGPTSNSPFTNSAASFDWSDSDSDDPKPNLPPPYDPFSKKPTIQEPSDPTNLQEVFHGMRSEGLTNSAIKMFDALSKDGRTHEAMALFAVIKDKGTMPDVVAHTAVIEAYANAGGHSKEAVRSFERMLASGVEPNVYTYAVLIKGLARDGRIGEVRKFLAEMMGKGMRPNAGVCVEAFEACVREEKVDEGRRILEEMKGRGFAPEEKEVREFLGKRGKVVRSVMGLIFGK